MLKTLGLVTRAQKLVSGSDMVIDEIRKGHAYLVILASDAASNTTKQIKDKTTYYKVPLIIKHTKEELSKAISKRDRAVIAILDQGFAKILMEKE